MTQGTSSAPAPAPPRSVVGGLIRAARPQQWPKNVLVFAAPGAAGALFEADVLGPTLLALVAFVLASAGTYLVNDVADREEDARHPVKRSRPVAAGLVPYRLAAGVGIVLLAVAVALPFTIGAPALAAVIGTYVAITAAYSAWLKHVALIDLVAVAAGFVLRAVAGAAATDLALSKWFLIVASFGSLYVVANKRFAELRAGLDRTRPALAAYTPELLREIRFTSAAVTIAAYVLWAFENAEMLGASALFELSIVPFVLALYRYALAVDQGAGEAPEQIFRRDRPIQILALVWAVLFAVAVTRVR
ncbi:MAG: decaprenyl-phosphate phosphoribosyltransferase [Actinobacteria bacterium]|nr:decaprenyl-phosphate phosphoribosyltransferase [Actinomycetota bacterium]